MNSTWFKKFGFCSYLKITKGVLIGWLVFVSLMTFSSVWEMLTANDQEIIVNKNKKIMHEGKWSRNILKRTALQTTPIMSPLLKFEFPLSKFELCDAIEKFINKSSVGDFGAGLGLYGRCWLRNYTIPNVRNKTFIESFKEGMKSVSLFDKPKVISSYEGYDKEPNIKFFTKGFVNDINLEFAFGLTKRFDWVICLDVWQSIDPSSGVFFVNNLYKHSKEGVILTWISAPGTNSSDHNRIKEIIDKNMTQEKLFKRNLKGEELIKSHLKNNVYKERLMVYKVI